MDFSSGKTSVDCEAIIQLTQLINMLNETNTQFALINLTKALEKGNSQQLTFTAFEEDLVEIYRFAEDNGALNETSQILLSYLAYSSSNYPVLALLRNSLNNETN